MMTEIIWLVTYNKWMTAIIVRACMRACVRACVCVSMTSMHIDGQGWTKAMRIEANEDVGLSCALDFPCCMYTTFAGSKIICQFIISSSSYDDYEKVKTR